MNMENNAEKPLMQTETIDSAIDTILKAVPEEQKDEAIKALMIIKEEAFEGPIPPPSLFREYEATLPGSADRILKLAESQQAHRIEIEKTAVNSQMRQGGTWSSFRIYYLSDRNRFDNCFHLVWHENFCRDIRNRNNGCYNRTFHPREE